MIKKLFKLGSLILFLTITMGCSPDDTNSSLYLLNWGDYIDEELLVKFEEKYDVEVILSDVESNEAMYEQIKTNRTSYDIAIPSDYMIDQLEQENLLLDIDFSKLKNYSLDNISKLAREDGPDASQYIPYFNGTLGIMYNKKKFKNIEQIIEKEGWNVLFDHSLLPDAKIGMYNSSRDAFAAALLRNNLSVNSTNKQDLDKAYQDLKQMNYDIYGDDNLKKNVVTGNLDVALVYSGDFYEELIVATDEGNDIDFGFYAPTNNNYWVDGMVIPKHAKNIELAHKFIDFMLDEDNAIQNAEYVGYPSGLNNVMDYLDTQKDYDYLTKNPYYNPNKIKNFKGEVYRYLGLDYMMELEEMFTKSKSK